MALLCTPNPPFKLPDIVTHQPSYLCDIVIANDFMTRILLDH